MRRRARIAAARRTGGRPPAPGITPGITPGLTLADVLRTTAVLSPSARAARWQLDAARGGVAVASAAFDAQVQSIVGGGRQREAAYVSPTLVSATQTRSVDYQVGIAKRLPWGVVVTPTVGLSQLGVLTSGVASGAAAGGTIAGVAPTTRAKAGLGVAVPLGKDRFGRAVAAGMRAADSELDASTLDLRQAAAQAAYEAAVAYWSYAAARQRLDVQRETERRAQLLVDETRELIRADERPAGDLAQLLGNLATRRAQRVTAEQAVDEARQQLGVVMGVPAATIAALPAASTPYPVPNDSAPRAGAPSVDATDATAPNATAPNATAPNATAPSAAPSDVADRVLRRPDVLAAAARRRAARDQVDVAMQATRPRVDLVVDASYAGLDQGFGVDRFVSPLYRNVPGLTTNVQLQFDLPVRNAAAGGLAAQREAEHEQRRIVEADLARRALAAVAVATSALARGRDALRESTDAVRLARQMVDNEKQKFRLAMATQFDVVNAEEALTNALLAEIAARRGYAGALAALRFAAGDLAPDDVAAAAPIRDDRGAAASSVAERVTRAVERATAALLNPPRSTP